MAVVPPDKAFPRAWPRALARAAAAALFVTAAGPAAAQARPDTVTVVQGDIQDTVEASGKLQLRTWADAYAQVGGQVKAVLVALGDTVEAGQALVDIAPAQQPAKAESGRAQMARLQAELADQRAQLEFAQLQFQRQTALKAQNAGREEAFESARMGAASARARVDAIVAQIGELEATARIDEDARGKTMVKAPLAGTVVALSVRAGQAVGAAQPAAPLLRIADLAQMTVAARVAEDDVTRLAPGMAATFTTPGYPGKRWSGTLRQVVPVPADGTGEQGKQAFYTVLFEVANPDRRLMSGMSVQVRFLVGQAHAALLVPTAGLGTPGEDGRYAVNVLDAGGHVAARLVQVGVRNRHQAQVLAGLAAGDRVLVGPAPAAPDAPAAADAPPLPDAMPPAAAGARGVR